MTSDTQTSPLTGVPLVVSTQSQKPIARLLMRNDLGQIVQQWLIKQNKCTLGSAASCSLRCTEPGIAPYHALLVVGARQTFLRALAPKLTRDGLQVNEILLTDESGSFEIAGHHFELSRGEKDAKHQDDQLSSNGRLKFTLARPFELNNRAHAAEKPLETPAEIDSGTPTWVAKLVQSAIEPLECQLHNVLGPIAELQAESRRQRRMRRKKREIKRKQAEQAEELGFAEPQQQAQQAAATSEFQQQLEAIVARQAASLDTLAERISDVGSQLAVIESISAQERETDAENSEVQTQVETQTAAIEQLQTGIVAVSAALQNLQERQQVALEENAHWKSDVQSQLGSIAESLKEADRRAEQLTGTPEILEALERLQSNQAKSQQEIDAWKEDIHEQVRAIHASIEQASAEDAADASGNQLAEQLSLLQSRQEESLQEAAALKAEMLTQLAQLQAALEEAKSAPTDYAAETTQAHRVESAPEIDSLEQPVDHSIRDERVHEQEFHTEEHVLDETLQVEDVQVEDVQVEDVQVEDVQVEDVQVEDVQVEDVHVEDAQVEDVHDEYTQDEHVNGESSHAEQTSFAASEEGLHWAVPESSSPEADDAIENSGSPEADVDEIADVQNATNETVEDWASAAEDAFDATAQSTLEHDEVSDETAELHFNAEDEAAAEQVASAEDTSFESMALDPTLDDSEIAAEESLNSEATVDTEEQGWPTLDTQTVYEDEVVSGIISDFTPPAPPAEDLHNNPIVEDTDSETAEFHAPEIDSANETLGENPAALSEDFFDSTAQEENVHALEVADDEIASTEASAPSSEIAPEEFETEFVFDGPETNVADGDVQLESTQSQFFEGSWDTPAPQIDDEESEELISETSASFPEADTANVPHQEDHGEDAVVPLESEIDSDVVETGLPSWWTEADKAKHSESLSESNEDQPPALQQSLADILDSQLVDSASDAEVSDDASEEFFGLTSDFESPEAASETDLPGPTGLGAPDLEIVENDSEEETEFYGLGASEPEPEPAMAPQVADEPEAESPVAGLESSVDAVLSSETSGAVEEDDSVEDYMRKLLARMRGVPEAEVEMPSPKKEAAPVTRTIDSASRATKQETAEVKTDAQFSSAQSSSDQAATLGATDEVTANFDPEKYVPRALAPEATKNLAAMRELANSSARTAINTSNRQRHVTSVLLKLSISGIGFFVAVVLLAINGLAVNIGLVATFASIVVAVIWGYDGLTSLKPLLQSELVLNPATDNDDSDEDQAQPAGTEATDKS